MYLAAVLAAHAQKGLPAFSIYGHDVQDATDTTVPADVAEKILRFARCAVAVGWMKNKAYVNLGGVAMGIAGSYCDASMFQKYLGIRVEWVDMTEIIRRITLEIYDHEEYDRALAWVKANCKEGLWAVSRCGCAVPTRRCGPPGISPSASGHPITRRKC